MAQLKMHLLLPSLTLGNSKKCITSRSSIATFGCWTVFKSRFCGFAAQKYSTKPQLKNCRLARRYSDKALWAELTPEQSAEIGEKLADLPSKVMDPEEEAKHFDYLILAAQIGVLQTLAVDEKIQASIQKLMLALEEQSNIPAIKRQMELIQSLSGDQWWVNVTVGMLEHVRRQLRMLIKLIEKRKRAIIYTDFEDELGDATTVTLPTVSTGIDFDRFKAKTMDYLRSHKDHIAFAKLRKNQPITTTDLAELERIMLEQAGGHSEHVERLKAETEGLGLFVRSLVGLEPQAANEAMSKFLSDASATQNQISFVRMIVEQLTYNGAMSKDRLYEAPFTDIAVAGPDSVFTPAKVIELFSVIDEIRQRAVA